MHEDNWRKNIQVKNNTKLDSADGDPTVDVGFDVAVDLISHDQLCWQFSSTPTNEWARNSGRKHLPPRAHPAVSDAADTADCLLPTLVTVQN